MPPESVDQQKSLRMAGSPPRYQFVHETSFASVMGQGRPSKSGVKGKAKWSSTHIVGEVLRLPGHIQHIAQPSAPISIYGIDPSQIMGWHNDLVAASKSIIVSSSTGLRRQRKDTPILLGVVASYPGTYDPFNSEYLRWRDLVTEWVLVRYGKEHVAFGLEHADESTGHLHFGIHNFGGSVKPLMAGPKAVAEAQKSGLHKSDLGHAYRLGCKLLQDEFQEKVGKACGLARISPHPRIRRERATHLRLLAAEERDLAREARLQAEALSAKAKARESELAEKARLLDMLKVEFASRRDADIARIQATAKEASRRIRTKSDEARQTWQEANEAKIAMIDATEVLMAENERRDATMSRRERSFMKLIETVFPDQRERTNLLRQFGLTGQDPIVQRR